MIYYLQITKAKTTPELVSMVKDMFNSRELNPKFLVPIFGALTKVIINKNKKLKKL